MDSQLPALSLELTFLKLEYGAGMCPKATVETAALWEPLSCSYSILLQHTISTENWRLLVSGRPPVVPKEQEEGDTGRGPGRVECLHPGVVLSLFTVDCPRGPRFGNCACSFRVTSWLYSTHYTCLVVHWVPPTPPGPASEPGWQDGTYH